MTNKCNKEGIQIPRARKNVPAEIKVAKIVNEKCGAFPDGAQSKNIVAKLNLRNVGHFCCSPVPNIKMPKLMNRQ